MRCKLGMNLELIEETGVVTTVDRCVLGRKCKDDDNVTGISVDERL